MKFITVRDLRTSPAQIWKDLPTEREMVITNNGKPIALLTPVGDANLEETLAAVRRAHAIQSVKQMQQTSMRRGTTGLPESEIQDEIIRARTEHS
ncbi:MAG: type II toxin-antitoxin system Phd/YefM family antitoxin [Spirochaetia bacterium]|nr:type II toxin-antitoxin system Phd/YefM family antitoxin [Spirochaetia bacterium]